MIRSSSKLKVEYGDFQTPLALAEQICAKLLKMGVSPDAVVEPTCGVGSFIQASAKLFPSAHQIIGVEINSSYLRAIETNQQLAQDPRIQVQQGNFFEFDWSALFDRLSGKILVLGNLPWVTNAQQGLIGGKNLPQKTNFYHHSGLDAITGRSNFDISEWMLIRSVEWLQHRDAGLAMLCKTSVARKLLTYIRTQNLNLSYCATYGIDAKKYFDATVDACLLFCEFDANSRNYFCDVFSSLAADTCYRIGYWNDTPVRDIAIFDKLKNLHHSKPEVKWRSGVKHDCSSVMELRRVGDRLINGLEEAVDIEETCLFPLVKGSDVAQNRLGSTDRYVIIPQKQIGEPTAHLQNTAPKTWRYLTSHAEYLDSRKSKIYLNSPRFSIFGVGPYTFLPWKVAICGLYKKLDFRLVGKTHGKPTIFDDTVYFLSFEDEQSANQALMLLNSQTATDFYSALIFWDEKRPIKASILNRLDLTALAEKLAVN